MTTVTTTEENRENDSLKIHRFPHFCFILIFTLWMFYLWGIYTMKNAVRITLNSPISPPSSLYWFYYVDWYPSCKDLRMQLWRLISYQFVHVGIMHIGKL